MTHIVAAIQMNSSEIVADNLQTVAKLIYQAVAQKSQLVVLPEMFAIMTLNRELKLAAGEQYGYGVIQDFLADQAKRHQIWIVGGTIPINNENNKVSASCLVFNPQGEVAGRYDKIHLFDVTVGKDSYLESATVNPGDTPVIIDTPIGKLGVAVCYDIRFPELFRLMFNQGAEIFAVPAAFTEVTGKAHWEVLVRSRAIENFSYLIGAAQVGEHAGQRRTYGHSLIINPWGEILNKQALETGVITAEVDLQRLYEIRSQIPVFQHQRIFSIR